MILLKRANSFLKEYYSALPKEPYLKINLVFAGVVVLILAYSGIFSPEKDNYPVVCIHEKITGQPCASCGLSHSFSLIVRGRFDEAFEWNPYGMRIFLFFFAQLLMRVAFSIYFVTDQHNRKQLILFDISGSIIIFLIAFWPLMRQLVLF
jgi:hypothetical protein